MSNTIAGTRYYYVIIALSHDMGEFQSTRVYDEKAAEDLVMKLRADDLNVYRKEAYFEIPGFTPKRIYP